MLELVDEPLLPDAAALLVEDSDDELLEPFVVDDPLEEPDDPDEESDRESVL